MNNDKEDQPSLDLKLAVEKVQSGDISAFPMIIRHLQKNILLYCYYLLEDQAEAEDAAQDIFIKCLRRIQDYVPTASFSAWVYKIAHNHCIDLIKKRNRMRQMLSQYRRERAEEDKGNKYTDQIIQLLEKLNTEEKRILLLRALEEYSFDEIGAIMDLKPATVRKKYERIRKKIVKREVQGGRQYEHSLRG
ncbi:hypothetical protein AWM70_21610 [Paenibacillus yonginensis]|uniref:RNA polymerase subunit sigma n=1 Tax=Paenibacillus yonginensis TaxID=1462996 RepID=A0A1B1N5Y1_9BACL|nr:RNA polymerase sigma factor [Paenibacillus yonginensis]ANS76858.1 hypothetical protein AWM70_21610 [Paenibacillus yonginensis]